MVKRKTVDEKIDELAIAVGKGFDGVEEMFEEVHVRLANLDEKLDRIESKVTGLAGRVEVLEDVVRMVRTKLSL